MATKVVRIYRTDHNDLEITSVGEKIFIKTGVGFDSKIIDLKRVEWDTIVETLK